MVYQLIAKKTGISLALYISVILSREPKTFQDMILMDRNYYLHLSKETSSQSGNMT